MSYILAPDLDRSTTIFSHHNGTERSWYHELVNGSDTLLICLGDSWTWGDALGNISNNLNQIQKTKHENVPWFFVEDDPFGNDDEQHRLTHIYGHLVSSHHRWDFVNLAICGGSNIHMHDHLKWILSLVSNRYKKIIVVATLTELGREMVFDPIWTENLPMENLDSFLMEYERRMLQSFDDILDQYVNVQGYIARNFTYTYDENKDLKNWKHLPMTWVDRLAHEQQLYDYPNDLRLLSQMGLRPVIETIKKAGHYGKFKEDFFQMFLKAEEAIDWLDSSNLNSNYATRHPLEKGHKIWADYLIDNL